METKTLLRPRMKGLERIGAGSSGSVWGCPGGLTPNLVLKREDGPETRSLRREYRINRHIAEALAKYRERHHGLVPFAIPVCYNYVTADDVQWFVLGDRFPGGHPPCNALVYERIPPFGGAVRSLLIDSFFHADDRGEIRRCMKNDHCLIRPYLGRRSTYLDEPGAQLFDDTRPRFNTLRNMILHFDRMDDFCLPVPQYIVALAHTYAFLIWVAKVDAGGVEFVLAPPRKRGPQDAEEPLHPVAELFMSDTIGAHVLWLLDFEQCQKLSMDRKGMTHAARCFLRNDPYFPRPGREEQKDRIAWDMFRDQFLGESKRLLRGSGEARLGLPVFLMDEICRLSRDRKPSHA